MDFFRGPIYLHDAEMPFAGGTLPISLVASPTPQY